MGDPEASRDLGREGHHRKIAQDANLSNQRKHSLAKRVKVVAVRPPAAEDASN